MGRLSFKSETEKDTLFWGERLARHLRRGDVVTLSGSLGAGKTVLAKAVIRALGCDDTVVSPTFTLIQEYEASLPIYHMDLYRIHGEDDFISTGGEELLYGDGICLVEWSDKIKGLLPPDTIGIAIKINEDSVRTITLESSREINL